MYMLWLLERVVLRGIMGILCRRPNPLIVVPA